MLPTVITDIKDESCCMKEEIFGPVTCVVPFDSEDEVIQRANSVKYGLAATVWSSNVGRIHRVAKKLQSGLVWTNCWLIRELNLPFGGMKSSGVGREGAKDSYEFFTEVKTITIKHWPWLVEKPWSTAGCRESVVQCGEQIPRHKFLPHLCSAGFLYLRLSSLYSHVVTERLTVFPVESKKRLLSRNAQKGSQVIVSFLLYCVLAVVFFIVLIEFLEIHR